jgi:hypothetical protein
MSDTYYLVFKEDIVNYGNIDILSSHTSKQEAIESLDTLAGSIIKEYDGKRQLTIADKLKLDPFIELTLQDDIYPSGYYYQRYMDNRINIIEKETINGTKLLIPNCSILFNFNDQYVSILSNDFQMNELTTNNNYPNGYYIKYENDNINIYEKYNDKSIWNSQKVKRINSYTNNGDNIQIVHDKSFYPEKYKNGFYIINQNDNKLLCKRYETTKITKPSIKITNKFVIGICKSDINVESTNDNYYVPPPPVYKNSTNPHKNSNDNKSYTFLNELVENLKNINNKDDGIKPSQFNNNKLDIGYTELVVPDEDSFIEDESIISDDEIIDDNETEYLINKSSNDSNFYESDTADNEVQYYDNKFEVYCNKEGKIVY